MLAKCDISCGADVGDLPIIQRLGLEGCISQWSLSHVVCHGRIKVIRDGCWKPPEEEVLKVNIDGSSKVGRDSFRVVQFFFLVYKGFHTSNFMEAWLSFMP